MSGKTLEEELQELATALRDLGRILVAPWLELCAKLLRALQR